MLSREKRIPEPSECDSLDSAAVKLSLPSDLDEREDIDGLFSAAQDEADAPMSSDGYVGSLATDIPSVSRTEVNELSSKEKANLKSMIEDGCLKSQPVFRFVFPWDRPGLSMVFNKRKAFEIPKPVMQLVDSASLPSAVKSGNPLPSDKVSRGAKSRRNPSERLLRNGT